MKSNSMLPNGLRSNTFNMIPVWLEGRKWLWVVGAAIYTLLYSAWIFLKWTNATHESIIANLGYLPLSLFSVVSALYAANQKQIGPLTRRAWQFLAVSLIFLLIADLIYLALDLTRGINFPDVPDFFYLGFYPLAFIGLITIPSQLSDPGQKKTWKLDIAITVVSFTAILWYFIIAPNTVSVSENWLSRIVAGAYPIMDMLLLASIVSLLFRKSEINTRKSLYILTVGLLSYVIADIAYAWLVLQGRYHSGSFVDIISTISYFSIGLAAMRQASPYLVDNQKGKAVRSGWLTSLLPFLFVLSSVLTSLYSTVTGNGTNLEKKGLWIGTTFTIILIMVRQIITMRENSRLVNELSFASDQLRASSQIFENRIQERTRELENQTNGLRLTAQIARDALSARDLSNLLKRSATLILERFNLYHTAIFLLDQQREYIILAASPTEAGQQLMAENYKLPIGTQDIVAEVASTGEPITILENLRLSHPLLPNSNSEMALPLKVEGNLIGVLDIHSEKIDAFNQDDIAIMQILADQIATAIDRARLLERVEQSLSDLEQGYGQFTGENWKRFEKSGAIGSIGYRFDNVHIQPIKEIPPQGDEALQMGKTIFYGNGTKPAGKNVVAIPINLRGRTIGVVTVQLKEGYSQTTIATLESAIERLASSLESARLYEEARLRADRELSISRVTTAISASTEYEHILQTTVREIGNILNDTEVAIQILEEPTGVKRPERREQ